MVRLAIKSNDFIGGIDKSTGVSDGYGGLFLVTCQHPHFNGRLLQLADCLLDLILQLVLNGCYGHKAHLLLNLTLQLTHFLVTSARYDCQCLTVS